MDDRHIDSYQFHLLEYYPARTSRALLWGLCATVAVGAGGIFLLVSEKTFLQVLWLVLAVGAGWYVRLVLDRRATMPLIVTLHAGEVQLQWPATGRARRVAFSQLAIRTLQPACHEDGLSRPLTLVLRPNDASALLLINDPDRTGGQRLPQLIATLQERIRTAEVALATQLLQASSLAGPAGAKIPPVALPPVAQPSRVPPRKKDAPGAAARIKGAPARKKGVSRPRRKRGS